MSAVPQAQQPVLLREDRDGICTLTMNRPQQMNLLTGEMLTALQDAFSEISSNRKIRVVILTGTGKGFSAGHDLKEIRALKELPKIEALFGQCSRMMQTITVLPQPVIAKVQGAAAAAGCQLVAQCDLAVAADTVKFVTSGVNWGFFCSTPGVAVGRNLSRKHAMEMLLTGEPIDAQKALEWGLVNKVVPADKLDEEIDRYVQIILGRSAAVIEAGKRTFYDQIDQPLGEAYGTAGATMVRNLSMEDAAEGMGAFLGKRTPNWKT